MPDKEEKRVKIKVEEKPEEEVQPVTTPQEDISKEAEVKTEAVETQKPETIDQPKKEKAGVSFFVLFILFLLGLILGAGLIGGVFYYKTKVEKTGVSPTPTPASSPTDVMMDESSPSPSPEEASLKLSEYKVQILNGSGTKGAAGKIEALVNDAGLTDTTTGNASSYDYQETEIALKSSVPSSVYDTLVDSLTDYKTTKGGTLSDSSSYDIVITVGQATK